MPHLSIRKNFSYTLVQYQGFSMLECLVVVAIVVILSSFAITGFYAINNKYQAKSVLQEIKNFLHLGKQYALHHNATITLYKSKDRKSCSGDWHEGLLLFIDHNANRKLDVEDKIIRVHKFAKRGGKIELKAFPSKNYMQFRNHGIINSSNGSFVYCHGNISKALIVNNFGTIRSSYDSDGDGFEEDARGNNIVCD
ncbi:MAG: hypothetical protein COB50_00475 [Thiotrichales bacterium]|nr:MAG: hypothetical protein COB50_00475 [Thiotrichales bacterium]